MSGPGDAPESSELSRWIGGLNVESQDVPTRCKVVIVGQGYVGLPLAARGVDAGHDVVGIDTDLRRVKRLQAGSSYVEDVPSSTLEAMLGSGRYHPSDTPADCEGFDVALITVPTPLRDDAPDLSAIEAAARMLAEHLEAGACVILESTTYPGTTEELVAPILEDASGLAAGADFLLGYSPERIDPGNRQWTLVNTPKIVSGVDEASLEAVRSFYDTLVDETVPVSSPRVAELAKLLENTFRHVNIALVNELAMFAHDLDIDIWETIDAAATKPFGFMRFTPGPGVGGHCLPIDPAYLSWRVKRSLGEPFRFVELAQDINDHMPRYVVSRVIEILNRDRLAVNGSTILLLGLSYKKNTGDTRGSPALVIAQHLLDLGAAVRAADPHVTEDGAVARLERVECTPAEIESADLVVLVTDHDDFDLGLIGSRARRVLDTRRCVSGENVVRL